MIAPPHDEWVRQTDIGYDCGCRGLLQTTRLIFLRFLFVKIIIRYPVSRSGHGVHCVLKWYNFQKNSNIHNNPSTVSYTYITYRPQSCSRVGWTHGSGRGSRFCRIFAGRVGSALRIFKFFTDYFLVPESI